MKFKMKKGKGSVNRFTDSNGIVHYPGDIVDLPASYKGSAWLEASEAEKPVKVPAAKVEKIESTPVEAPEIPFSQTKRRTKHHVS